MSYTPFNWNELRPINDSMQTGFEEFCCQIAMSDAEKPHPDADFVRKGRGGDAGVEGYWKLPNNDEYGYQAKFFQKTPDSSQWGQIDGSVKKALEKHPLLKKYTLCMPVNRSESRIEDYDTFMNQWETHKGQWQKWAAEKTMEVDFAYWGESELLLLVQRANARGLFFFWFQKEYFSSEWFKKKAEVAVSDAHDKYDPLLNFKLPIAETFEWLAKTDEYYKEIESNYGAVIRGYRKVFHWIENVYIGFFDEYRDRLERFKSYFEVLKKLNDLRVQNTDFKSIYEECEKGVILFIEIQANFFREHKKVFGDYKKEHEFLIIGFNNDLVELRNAIHNIRQFTGAITARLSQNPYLLVTGKAGSGKTHLFCDVTNKRIDRGLPTLLFHGIHFDTRDVWHQMREKLGINAKREEFLGALQASAIEKGSRALILIDAINESDDKTIWRKQLAGMLTELSYYPWIGLSVSIRSTYMNDVQDIFDNIEYHRGFSGHEFDAARMFFTHYKIAFPSIPLLIPEFSNPLFLKLLCQAIQNLQMTRIPEGIDGISSVFEFFLNAANKKLAQLLDFDSKDNKVQIAVNSIASQMLAEDHNYIQRTTAKSITDKIHNSNGYEMSLFRHLISEGILIEERNNEKEFIRFTYERFGDHLIAKYILDHYPFQHQGNGKDISNDDNIDLIQYFEERLIKDSRYFAFRRLLEALAIQIPERYSVEIFDISPKLLESDFAFTVFVESLLWRKADTISDRTFEIINEYIIPFDNLLEKYLDNVISLATVPKHPLNAEWLNDFLKSHPLPQRDAFWSIYLNDRFETESSIDRHIKWALSSASQEAYDDESIILAGIVICWFFTSSNRALRDKATKALINLFTDRLHIFVDLIPYFLDVDDLYVLERLFAAVYGAVLRSHDKNSIKELAENIYYWIFEHNAPPVHLLLRNYARCTIEYAIFTGCNPDVDISILRPPYLSEWPKYIPEKESLINYDWSDDLTTTEEQYLRQYSAVMDSSNFARYIIGTNSGHFSWHFNRLEQRNKTCENYLDEFINTLSSRQLHLFELYFNVLMKRKSENDIFDLEERRENRQRLDKRIKDKRNRFIKSIGTGKKDKFNHVIERCLDGVSFGTRNLQIKPSFPLELAQRWICNRVFELGWTPERFGYFDDAIGKYSMRSRNEYNVERIGKKYQWIAFYEFLAMVADNFEFAKDDYRGEFFPFYDGPWQIRHGKDIDPSFVYSRTPKDNKIKVPIWWCPEVILDWSQDKEHQVWLQNTDDLPNAQNLIYVVSDSDSKNWLVLENEMDWDEPTPVEIDPYELPRRRIYYQIRSYIVRKSDINEVFEWAKSQEFFGRWMPESPQRTDLFLGEFFWSPAFKYSNRDMDDSDVWQRDRDENLPCDVIVTTDGYLQEFSGNDSSIDESIGITLPSKFIFESMNLRWNGKNCKYEDSEGNVIAFDPSIDEKGSTACVIDKDKFIQFLNENELDIFWTLLGEKQILPTHTKSHPGPGLTELSGAYRLNEDGNVVGEIRASYKPYQTK